MGPNAAEYACPFCERLARGDYAAASPWAVSFAPLNPVTRGHTLVIPKEHVRDAGENPALTGKVMEAVAEMVSGSETDCNIITSIGPLATQTVYHFHVHVIPRREGDGLALPWTGQPKGAD